MGMRLNDIEETTGWFKHPGLMTAFILLHTYSNVRKELLELKAVHYHDKAKADQWRDDIIAKLRGAEGLIEPHTYARLMSIVQDIRISLD